jgi:hypothetical protein
MKEILMESTVTTKRMLNETSACRKRQYHSAVRHPKKIPSYLNEFINMNQYVNLQTGRYNPQNCAHFKITLSTPRNHK